MQTACRSTSIAVGQQPLLTEIEASLAAAFGATFVVWINRRDRWQPAVSNRDVAKSSGSDKDLLELIEQVARSRQPQLNPLDGDSYRLALPTTGNSLPPLVATATITTTDAGLLRRMARMYVDGITQRSKLDQYRQDLTTSVRQISDDLEDITFWRQLAQRLEISDPAQDMWQALANILPLVARAAKAQSVVLVAARISRESDDPSAVDVGSPAVAFGDARVDNETYRRLVDCYRESARFEPVVENQLETCELGEVFPGVREFILVPVAKDDFFLGWMLAINREKSPPAGGEHGASDVFVHPAPGALEFGSVEASLLWSTAAVFAAHARNVRTTQERQSLLVETNRAKNAFLANIGHQLRGPLTSILGFAKTLLSAGDLVDVMPEQVSVIQSIVRSGDQLLRVINDILDLSRLEAGSVTTTRTDFSPAEVAGEAVSLVQSRAQDAGLKLEAKCEYPILKFIHSDHARLRQVLINLLEYATAINGIRRVEIITRLNGADTRQHRIEFEITGGGPAIARGRMDHLFEPFAENCEIAENESQGFGLRLAVSQRIARLLGGKLTAEGANGQGVRFRLEIPAGTAGDVTLIAAAGSDPPDEAAADNAAGDVDDGLRRRVLLLEDNGEDVQACRLMLQQAGFDVTVAVDGQMGLEHALVAADTGRPFELILINVHSAPLRGCDVVKLLRGQGLTGPVIGLTNQSMQRGAQAVIQAGCNLCITKPLSRDTLIKAVEKTLDQQHVSNPTFPW